MISPHDQEILNAYYREYDTLREESLQTMGNRSQIISFGLAFLGALIAGTLVTSKPTTLFLQLMFNDVVPIIAILIYYIWFTELERMVRCGKFIQDLEKDINAILDHLTLSWEHDLERMRMRYSYLVVAALFLGIAAGSPAFGASLDQSKDICFQLNESFCRPSLVDILLSPLVAWAAVLISGWHTATRWLRNFNTYAKFHLV